MKWVLYILIALPLLAQGQSNLVPNGGFEQMNNCPDYYGNLVASYVQYWTTPSQGSPDYYNDCGIEGYTTATGVFGPQPALSGDAYIGIYCFSGSQIDLREYIQVQFTEPLHAGVRYKVSFYVSVADSGLFAINTLGAYLSTYAISSNDVWVLDNVEPQILNAPNNSLVTPDDWVLITDTFVSRTGGGERYITIGNFNPDSTSGIVQYWTGCYPTAY